MVCLVVSGHYSSMPLVGKCCVTPLDPGPLGLPLSESNHFLITCVMSKTSLQHAMCILGGNVLLSSFRSGEDSTPDLESADDILRCTL